MKLPSFLFGLLLIHFFGIAAVPAQPIVPLTEAVAAQHLSVTARGPGRESLTLTLRNSTAQPVTVAIPAGLIATGENGDRVIGLRAATATVPAGSSADVAWPSAALSVKSVADSQTFTVSAASEPQLAPLLKVFAEQTETTPAAAQLAILCLREDATFTQWRQFHGSPADAAPTPAEVSQAIDALALLRSIDPARRFALAQDADLKARALRNPWARAKAMAVFGLDFGDGAVPPDLQQLLHMKADDNCPICRQRALMQAPANLP